MLLINEDSNVEASNRTHLTEKKFFYSIATKEILVHVVVVWASLQGKVAFRNLAEVLCLGVFFGQGEQTFFLLLVS